MCQMSPHTKKTLSKISEFLSDFYWFWVITKIKTLSTPKRQQCVAAALSAELSAVRHHCNSLCDPWNPRPRSHRRNRGHSHGPKSPGRSDPKAWWIRTLRGYVYWKYLGNADRLQKILVLVMTVYDDNDNDNDDDNRDDDDYYYFVIIIILLLSIFLLLL